MKKLKLIIPAMQSLHCQNRVKTNVLTLEGVTITSLQPGLLEIEFGNEEILKSVYNVINSAGYEIMGSDSSTIESDKKVHQFKSNIKCMGCVEAVAPAFNAHPGIDAWRVDIKNVDKILTIESNDITNDEIVELVKSKGFLIEPLK